MRNNASVGGSVIFFRKLPKSCWQKKTRKNCKMGLTYTLFSNKIFQVSRVQPLPLAPEAMTKACEQIILNFTYNRREISHEDNVYG